MRHIFTVSIGTVPRHKKTTVDEGTFHLDDQKLVAMRRIVSWKYLGVPFTPEGRLRFDPTVKLTVGLQKICSLAAIRDRNFFYLLCGCICCRAYTTLRR